jgi:predicted metal-dependent HD superfamily phosphohydrolase
LNYYALIKQIDTYITGLFAVQTEKELLYHNLVHTQQVVASSAKIATHYKLNEKDYFIVIVASWFHDIGYLAGDEDGHELTGAEMAATFLKDKNLEADTIIAIQNCIMATRMPQSPTTLPEQIVCDADLFMFGTGEFDKRNNLMRKEAEWRLKKKIGKSEWRKSTIHLMESHHFHTDYAHHLLNGKEAANLDKLKHKESDDEDGDATSDAQKVHIATLVPVTAPVHVKKQKTERPERGIETMFRITSGNNQRLSDMADNKAHIMITTTSIIISVLLSVLLRKLEDYSNLIFPTLMMLTVCVITMVFSILSTRPSIPHGTFTQQDIDDEKVNLLFFGNFYRMTYDKYFAGMKEMMNDRDFLYGSLTKDVYSQGVVLGRKYRLLRVAYDVFMFGMVVSVIAFVISSIFFGR